jgi:hypothetical protein
MVEAVTRRTDWTPPPTVPIKKIKRRGNFSFTDVTMRSWDSSVGVAMGYGLDGHGSMPGSGKKFCSSPHFPERP